MGHIRWWAIALLFAYGPCPALALSYTELLSRESAPATHQFAYGTERDQYGELWLPEGKGPHPVVVMIHGGCWQAQLPGVELMAQLSEDLRRSGIAVWNIEYRRLGTQGAGYPGTFLDIADAVDYLRQIAGPYQLDISHIVIVGHSAGGHLALWAAARHRLTPASPLYRKAPMPIHAVVTLAGINDLADYHDNGPSACGGPQTINQLVGASGRNMPYADTSPAALLPIGVSQMIVSGGADVIVPERFGANYAKAAQKSGDRAEAITIEDAGHFDLIDPESAAWQRIKTTLLSLMKADTR